VTQPTSEKAVKMSALRLFFVGVRSGGVDKKRFERRNCRKKYETGIVAANSCLFLARIRPCIVLHYIFGTSG
jgi:hypothetical protein